MRSQKGFTVIELIVVIILALAVATLFFIQKQNINAASRDKQRKTAINAMYYDLEKVFYPKYHYYPDHIDSKNLTAIDPDLFKDPNGYKVNNPKSSYHYLPSGCAKDKCQSYKLRTTLEKEADYIKYAAQSFD